MDQKAIIAFFNHCAPSWDAEMIRDEEVIQIILDNAHIRQDIHVLDVACGTGVLFPDYFARKVRSVTGIDIAPEMARRAEEKFPEAEVICGDVETYPFDKQYDAVMVYNAFPHFPHPALLLARLGAAVRPGGILSVAHGMSRAALAAHHANVPAGVSLELPEAEALAALFPADFTVTTLISDEEMYQVAARRS